MSEQINESLKSVSCAHCRWWETHPAFAYPDVPLLCKNPKLNERSADGASAYGFEVEGIETGPNFGCIHFERKKGN